MNTSSIEIEGLNITVEGPLTIISLGIFGFIDADNVNIRNATLQNSPKIILECAFFISLKQSHTISLQHSKFKGGGYGVYIQSSQFIVMNDVSIHNCENNTIHINGTDMTELESLDINNTTQRGLYLNGSSGVYLKNTQILNTGRDAIRILSTQNITISRSDIQNSSLRSGFGIAIFESQSFTISNSSVIVAKWEGIHIYGSSDFEITNVLVNVHSGVAAVIQCQHFSLTTLTLQNQKPHIALYIYICDNAEISDITFTNFTAPLTASQRTLQSSAGVSLYSANNITFRDCMFVNNNVTALKLTSSNVTFSGNLSFVHNQAYIGAAISLVQSSFITLDEDTFVLFLGNVAYLEGGAIFIDYNKLFRLQYHDIYGPLVTRAHCFLEVKGNVTNKRLWFENNTALHGGDVLYGGSLGLACSDRGAPGDWTCDSNCLLKFKLLSQMEGQCDQSSLISSDPIGVCFCSSNELPDCLTAVHPVQQQIYPGQTIQISVAVVGQDFGTVIGSVFAQVLADPGRSTISTQMNSTQEIQGTTKQCTKIEYTIFSRSSQATIVLASYFRNIHQLVPNESVTAALAEYSSFLDDKNPFPEHLLEFPKYINVSFLECPPGFELAQNLHKCECNSRLQELPGVTCNIQDQLIWRSGLVWIGQYNLGNNTQPLTDVMTCAKCPYNYCVLDRTAIHWSDPDSQCNGNRSGVLCGGCQSGLSLTLGNAHCQRCKNAYLALLIPFALAGVFLVLVIKFLNLTVADGALNGFIFYVNILKTNEAVFLPQSHVNPLTLFIAWLYLDWGIPSCFFDGYNAYWKTWLQYIFPLYIWMIAVFIIVIAKYSSRMASLIGRNSVPVLSTLFLLSYAKLFQTTVISLSFTLLDTPHGTRAVWSADGNIEYLGPPHIPLFLTAICVLLCLWLPYTTILTFEQWLKKLKIHVISCMITRLKPFFDAHCSCTKDRHRYWFGTLLVVRATIVLVAETVPSSNSSGIVFTVDLAATLLMAYSFIGPGFYTNYTLSLLEMSLFMNLALLSLSTFYVKSIDGNQLAASYTFIGIVLLQFLGLVIIRIIAKLKEKSTAATSSGYIHMVKMLMKI